MYSQMHDENKAAEKSALYFPTPKIPVETTAPNKMKMIQRKHNGLPDRLKTGIELISGLAMDDVQVHYNSPKPASLQALAYTQGSQIYLGPGQDKHLPHEAWHVVQQKQGRVKPTFKFGNVPINDSPNLEAEATQMGRTAAQYQLPDRLRGTLFESLQNDDMAQRQEGPTTGISKPKAIGNGRFVIDANVKGLKAGSVMVHDKDDTSIELTDLGVDSASRKQGLGEKLVRTAAQTGAHMGKSKISLAAQDNGSGRLINWYKKLGFNEVGINQRGFPKFEAKIGDFQANTIQRMLQHGGGGGPPSGRGWRNSNPIGPKGMTETVVEGHGELTPGDTFIVPDGTIIVIFQGCGIGMDDSHGIDIATGKGTQVQMPLLWDAVNGEYDTEPPVSGGAKVPGQGIRKIYYQGDVCPNFKLFPWDHPIMGVLNVQNSSYKIGFNPVNPGNFIYLQDIANARRGLIKWACCTVYR